MSIAIISKRHDTFLSMQLQMLHRRAGRAAQRIEVHIFLKGANLWLVSKGISQLSEFCMLSSHFHFCWPS